MNSSMSVGTGPINGKPVNVDVTPGNDHAIVTIDGKRYKVTLFGEGNTKLHGGKDLEDLVKNSRR